ncbi:MAG TPA: hypothetical protein VL688_03625 [Verrucomicrobiae bacterium]|jgi:hypothetical protein|nr:hypothetical protein [Verrucomicrobiae bacterium]
MRFLWSLIKLGVLLALLGMFFRTVGAKWLLSAYLQHELGTQVSVEHVRVDFINSQAKFSNVAVKNPMVFPDGTMMIIPKMFIDWNPAELLKGRVVLETLDMNIAEIRVLRAPDHGLNLRGVKLLRPALPPGNVEAEEEPAWMPQLGVQQFVLSVGRATYTDLTGENPLQKSYDLNLNHVVFRDIPKLRGIWTLITAQTLSRMGIEA